MLWQSRGSEHTWQELSTTSFCNLIYILLLTNPLPFTTRGLQIKRARSVLCRFLAMTENGIFLSLSLINVRLPVLFTLLCPSFFTSLFFVFCTIAVPLNLAYSYTKSDKHFFYINDRGIRWKWKDISANTWHYLHCMELYLPFWYINKAFIFWHLNASLLSCC